MEIKNKMSLDGIYSLSYSVLILSLVAGAIATCVIFKSGKIKERRLNKELYEAKLKTEKLRNDTENIRQENLKLSQELEAERIKRLNLEKSLEPRIIDVKSAKELINILKPFSGQKIQIVWFVVSPETINFAGQVKEIFLEAGWMVHQVPESRHESIPVGTCFSTENPESKTPALLALEKAFKTVIPDLYRCPRFGGLLPFAEFTDQHGNTIKAADIKPSDFIDFWIGLKPTLQ